MRFKPRKLKHANSIHPVNLVVIVCKLVGWDCRFTKGFEILSAVFQDFHPGC